MKTKRTMKTLSILFLCTQIFLCACGVQKAQKVTANDIPAENKLSADAEYITYQYEDLKEAAVTIVKAEVLDELTSENSLSEYDEDYGMVVRFCAVRSLRALEVYKGDLSAGDEFQVQECCAIYEVDGEYYQDTLDDTPPLRQGGTYILFLNGGDTMSGKPGIIGCKNGAVDLEQPETTDEFFDVTVKSIVEYESDLPQEDKNMILQSEEVCQIESLEAEEQSEIAVDTGEGETMVSLGVKEEGDGKIGVSLKTQ